MKSKTGSAGIMLVRLWRLIDTKRRTQFALLLVLMVIASFAEVISLGAVLPFLGALTSPEKIFTNPLATPFVNFFGILEPNELLLPMTVLFCISILFASAVRLLLIWSTTRLSFATGSDISLSIYRKTLHQPYRVHVLRNSSEIIDGVSFKSNSVIYNTILPSLTFISASIMLITILLALLYISPEIAMSVFFGFGVIYLFIVRLTKESVLRDSEKIAHESVQVIKCLQEGLGGIRDVLLDACQHVYCKTYQRADKSLRRAQGNNHFVSQSPRYGMEALGMVLIASLAYSLMKRSDNADMVIPLLGAFALGAQRLLPVFQQAYSSWINIKAGHAALREVICLLDQPINPTAIKSKEASVAFNQAIYLQDITYKYDNQSDYIFKKINLTILKGSRVGFIGSTGSGKSTLLDLIMGLLDPVEGYLKVDDVTISSDFKRSWQRRIAHVPQSIFLTDSSVDQNIAFGVDKEKIDHQRVRDAAQMAQVNETIEALPEQYDTFVGERGVRLSGGQRQRIGIARALYKQADVIVFDEATSALDNETEEAVMNAIEQLSNDLTVLIIAHRVSTLKKCDLVIKMDNGKIIGSGTYQEMIS